MTAEERGITFSQWWAFLLGVQWSVPTLKPYIANDKMDSEGYT